MAEFTKVQTEYPEHEKLARINEQSQWLGEFREWLGTQNISLQEYYGEPPFDGMRNAPDTNTLLARYFDIDLVKIENEKRAMIESIRNSHTA